MKKLIVYILFSVLPVTVSGISPVTELGPVSQALFSVNFASQISNLTDLLSGINKIQNYYQQSVQAIRKIANIPNELKEHILGYYRDGKALALQVYSDLKTGLSELEDIKNFYNDFLEYNEESIPVSMLQQRLKDLQNMINNVGRRAGKGVELIGDIAERGNRLQKILGKSKIIADAGSSIGMMEIQSELLAGVSEGMNEMLMQFVIMNEGLSLEMEEKLLMRKLEENYIDMFEDINLLNPFTLQSKGVTGLWEDIFELNR